ncbi:MAG: DUF655 domain-containing protein [Candidatus Woesearchaeota archaeon]|nr:DUF655 domain-containing protein [Candidatus Woesearchaeota archaeon]
MAKASREVKKMEHSEKRAKEEYAIVLDFLPNGYPFDTTPTHKKTPIVQALGRDFLTLLELVPKPGVTVQPGEEVYIGEEKRDKIHHIAGKLNFEKLTPTAEQELQHLLQEFVKKNEKKFIGFFNNSKPLTTRMHQLELLPGFGKKHMWEIIEARNEKPFENFEDLKKRVKLLPDPEKAIVKRIISELKGEDKHRIFVER